jgi:hypothetical protein
MKNIFCLLLLSICLFSSGQHKKSAIHHKKKEAYCDTCVYGFWCSPLMDGYFHFHNSTNRTVYIDSVNCRLSVFDCPSCRVLYPFTQIYVDSADVHIVGPNEQDHGLWVGLSIAPIKLTRSDTLETSLINTDPLPLPGGHRRHELGEVYSTAPPYYSCSFCHHEFSPYDWDSCKSYSDWVTIEKKYGNKSDSFWMAKWNEMDTSCISNEIALHQSENFYDTWKSTHPYGYYWLNDSNYMFHGKDYDMVGVKGSYGMGGRFSDNILRADTWFKIDSSVVSGGMINLMEEADKEPKQKKKKHNK